MENMIRALQPDLMGYSSALLFALLFFVIMGYFAQNAKKVDADENDVAMLSGVRRYGTIIIVVLTLLFAAYRVAVYSSVNRVPRNDADGSAVYDRMERNANPSHSR